MQGHRPRAVELINPGNGRPLRVKDDRLIDDLGHGFPITDGVARIDGSDGYSSNFSLQWTRFAATQLGDAGDALSRERFASETGWTAGQLDGQAVLEVGCGAGRFTRTVLEQGDVMLYSLDYSDAVTSNYRNNADFSRGRLHLFQASVYEMPFPEDSFDKVFCLGVLQHTPDFEGAVAALIEKARPGGEIVVDFYPIRGWWTKVHAKYLLRPITRRVGNHRMLRLIEENIDWLMWLHRALRRIGLGALCRFVPVASDATFPSSLTATEHREWTILDTFDMFAPRYDNPQRVRHVAEMFERHGAVVTFAGYVALPNGEAAVVRGTKVQPDVPALD